LPVTGTLAIFTHYPEEFQMLTEYLQKMCYPDNPFNGKYFKLIDPIIIPSTPEVPGATYTHLYIRRADPYRSQVGDIDFYLPKQQFEELKANLLKETRPNIRIFPGNNLDMIELYNPDIDVLAYIDTYRLDDPTTWSNQ
jgi:hypothetical protein